MTGNANSDMASLGFPNGFFSPVTALVFAASAAAVEMVTVDVTSLSFGVTLSGLNVQFPPDGRPVHWILRSQSTQLRIWIFSESHFKWVVYQRAKCCSSHSGKSSVSREIGYLELVLENDFPGKKRPSDVGRDCRLRFDSIV